MLADAFHNLSDLASLVVSWFVEVQKMRAVAQGRLSPYTFGARRGAFAPFSSARRRLAACV
eukprot:SAG31_NODE_437_length_15714_cov_8.527344_9_plen_61_part_00